MIVGGGGGVTAVAPMVGASLSGYMTSTHRGSFPAQNFRHAFGCLSFCVTPTLTKRWGAAAGERGPPRAIMLGSDDPLFADDGVHFFVL